jgi:hypothetical protein
MVHRFRLSLNPKRRIGTRRFQNQFFHLIDYSPLRSSGKIVFKGFDTTRRAFGKRLDSAVRTVAHIADNLMPRCCSLCKETITDALNLTSYQKLSRYTLHVSATGT